MKTGRNTPQPAWTEWINQLVEQYIHSEIDARARRLCRIAPDRDQQGFTINPTESHPVSVRRNPNGTLSIQPEPTKGSPAVLCWTHRDGAPHPVFHEQAMHRDLMEKAVLETLRAHWEDAGGRPDEPPRGYGQPDPAPGRRHRNPIPWENAAEHEEITLTQVNRLINGLLDQSTVRTGLSIFKSRLHLEQYNLCQSAKQALEPLLRTNPGIAVWFAHHQPAKNGRRPPRHPGQIVKSVRRSLAQNLLPDHLWKYTANLSVDQMGLICRENMPSHHKTMLIEAHATAKLRPSEQSVETAAQVIQNLVNIYHTRDPLRPKAGRMGKQTPEQHLSRNNAVRTAALYLTAERWMQPPHADYLRHITREGRTMRHPSAEHFERASQRWHEEFRQPRRRANARQPDPGTPMTWDSMLLETDVGEYRVKPLESTADLIAESQTMGHCIATYSPNAESGNARYFACRGPEARWTVEITRARHGWKANQIAGPENELPTPRARQLATAIASLYQEAEMESPHGHGAPKPAMPEDG